MMMKVRKIDGQFLYSKLSELFPSFSQNFSTICESIFSGYECKNYHYCIDDEDDVTIANSDIGNFLFSNIAGNVYKYVAPFVKENGDINNPFSRKDVENDSVTLNGSTSGNSNSNNMDESSPINATIGIINTPTFKSNNANNFTNNTNRTSSRTFSKNYDSPEYVLMFEKIKTYFIEAIQKEVERYIYEYRVIY